MTKLIEITGKAISGEWGNDDTDGTGIPVLRTTNFTNDGVINFNSVVTRSIAKKNLEEKYLQRGDIIIEKSGGSTDQPVGRVVYFDAEENKYLFNNFTGVLRIKDKSTWFPRYVFWALYYNYRIGGTKPYQNKTTGLHNLQTEQYIYNTEIHETSYIGQKRIAAILDKVDELISLRKKQLQKLDDLIKSRFVEMFGDPVDNAKRWPTKPLLEMGNCKNGMNFSNNETGISIHCLGVGDFQNKTVITDVNSLPMISLRESPSKEYLLHDGDIVFVRSNGNKALVGRCVAVYPGNIPTTFSGFCIRYRKQDNATTIPYLLRVLKTDSIRTKMAGRGANIQNLNQQILGTLFIPIPPIDLQEQYAVFSDRVDKSKVTIQQGIYILEQMKQTMMQKFFGEIDSGIAL